MRRTTVAALAALGPAAIAAGIMAAPLAAAEPCDPAVVSCNGPALPPSSPSLNASPPVIADDDQYPFDDDWYFNPAGGGTVLQPNHPSGGGGGAPAGGGGGGHR